MKTLDSGLFVIKLLKERGFDAYFVGGCVRDYLLNHPMNDIDVTTNATPYEVMRIFRNTAPTGLKYGTVTVLHNDDKVEVTTYRLDGEYKDHRRPEEVTLTELVTEDVKRRDFTINGLLMDEYFKVYDYVGGKADLENETIRAIGEPKERFNEDSLRLLRAVYFQSKLGFKIEEKTKEAMRSQAKLIVELAPERTLNEILKILRSRHQNLALKTLEETNLHKYLYGLEKGISHINKNINERVFIDAFFVLAFALNGHVDDYWKFSNIHKNRYTKAVELVLSNKEIDAFVLYDYGLEISLLANKVSFLLGKKKYQKTRIENLYNNLSLKSLTDLAIRGNDILSLTNKKQGAWLKQFQNHLVEEILKGHLKNTKEVLMKYTKEYFNEK